ncbi:MAG: sulfotransferase domain-containing protein, partial [Gammaproteobacteria bacterium]|nr:sulfotransferase domain-containing protein [Gammaproteobacteria bacterium]
AELDLAQICALRPKVQKNIAASRPGSVFVKTHNFLGAYDGMPLHEMSVTAGAVYVVRNPLDVVLSLADHFGLTVDDAILFMNNETTGSPTDEANVASVLSSWSAHVRSWTEGGEDATCVLRYEDLLIKPAKGFRSLVSFLGLNPDPALLRRAIRFSSFPEMRKQEQAQGFIERSPNSRRFFRAGRKDQWRTGLSREQIGLIVDAHREQMQHFKYVPPGY